MEELHLIHDMRGSRGGIGGGGYKICITVYPQTNIVAQKGVQRSAYKYIEKML